MLLYKRKIYDIYFYYKLRETFIALEILLTPNNILFCCKPFFSSKCRYINQLFGLFKNKLGITFKVIYHFDHNSICQPIYDYIIKLELVSSFILVDIMLKERKENTSVRYYGLRKAFNQFGAMLYHKRLVIKKNARE